MSRKTHTTAVVLIPPDSIQPPIQAIRRRHDRNYERWMPHITLLYPFAPRSEFDVISQYIKGAVQNIPTIHTTLATFSHFKHAKSCTLFLVPEQKNEIINLHTALLESLPDFNDTARFPGGFNPHLSVGQFNHQSLSTYQSQLQADWKPLHCEFTSICLIYRSPETDDRFVVAEEYPFQIRS